jgi:hypothetical protein
MHLVVYQLISSGPLSFFLFIILFFFKDYLANIVV